MELHHYPQAQGGLIDQVIVSRALSWRTAKTLAMAFPQTEERDHFGSPSFRVKGKIFAQLSARENKERRALVKLSLADQAWLTMSDPNTFVPAPHWGRHGWT
jgi:predicted DNA-binding protein (MmcQ/YjbR family)